MMYDEFTRRHNVTNHSFFPPLTGVGLPYTSFSINEEFRLPRNRLGGRRRALMLDILAVPRPGPRSLQEQVRA